MAGATREARDAEDPDVAATRQRSAHGARLGDEAVLRPSGTWWLYRRRSGRRLFVDRTPGQVALVALRTWDPAIAEDLVRVRWDEKVGPDVPLPTPTRGWRVMAEPDGISRELWPRPDDGHHAKSFPVLVYPLPEGVDMTG